ncbi:MAG TPA: glycosyltransferase family 2 protein, partial [Plasticicumulans sp.]|nr:glycosyltransferase family 2 protein [Plasticicumulans sp.]
FDLSLRAGRITHIAQVSNVKIVHHGGHAARKGWHHIRMFVRSGITFFNTHGWKLW